MDAEPNSADDPVIGSGAEKYPRGFVGYIAALQERLDPEGTSDGSYSLTILTGGMLVSGKVISAARFFSHIRESMRLDDPEEEPVGRKVFDDLVNGMRRDALAHEQSDRPSALYLQDAVIVGAGSGRIVLQSPGIWQVPLAHVAGATLAAMKVG